MTCEQVRLCLGAYVVGALEPAERSAVDVHLPACPPCRDELSSFAGLPGLLGRLSADEVVDRPSVAAPALLERTLAEMRRRRRLRRRVAAAAAVATVLALAGAGVGIAVTGQHPRPVVAAAGSVHAALTLQPRHWGTALRLRLSGVRPGEHCSLVAFARDGRREVAGAWEATYDGVAEVTGATSIQRQDLDSLTVVTAAGSTLVRLPGAMRESSGPVRPLP